MNPKRYIPLFIIVVVFSACKKDAAPVTRVVKFTSTTYETLGTFNSVGMPDYLLTRDSISAALLSFIASTLPDHKDLRTTHPELLESKAIADIPVTQSSDIFITFVSEGGGLTNSVAFYTYPTGQPPASAKDIKVITYIFPNSGYLSPLHAGDKVKIGRFEPGTSVGFVLLQSAWDVHASTLNNDVVHFCSNDILNPEIADDLKKHAVLISYTPENKMLIGFEDIDRTKPECDNDFNDVVVYATVTP